jgi:hypothetical protein
VPPPNSKRVFLLSPANLGGMRSKYLLSERSSSPIAAALRSAEGAPIGDVFSFVSGLYFRGKLTYARRFARPGESAAEVVDRGVFVITAGAGLRSPDTAITLDAFLQFAGTAIDMANPAYRDPLVTSARALSRALDGEADVVLLGSIASPKYVDALLQVFGDRLLFPAEFVGRGDMSRGGLLLRSADAGVELEYVPVRGAVRHGARPPKLEPLKRPRTHAP